MKVLCENDYCVYYKDGHCILEKINISFLGLCSDFIIIDIPEDELKKLRQTQLK